MATDASPPDLDVPLGGGYQLRAMSAEEFWPNFRRHYPAAFRGVAPVDLSATYSAEERAAIGRLAERMGAPLQLRFGVFRGDELVGWHVSDQRSAHELYMRNTGLLPEHQGRGVYTAMLRALLPHFGAIGFQVVTSRHAATNNAVIVPKLKAGFVITGLELADAFGTLVTLAWFANPTRRRLMDVRCGLSHPDAELQALLGPRS